MSCRLNEDCTAPAAGYNVRGVGYMRGQGAACRATEANKRAATAEGSSDVDLVHPLLTGGVVAVARDKGTPAHTREHVKAAAAEPNPRRWHEKGFGRMRDGLG